MPRCHVCGEDDSMAFRCSYCNQYHCSRHRLPEAHMCSNIGRAKAQEPVWEREAQYERYQFSSGSGGGVSRGTRPVQDKPKATWYILGAMVATFLAQMVTLNTAGGPVHETLFVLSSEVLLRPWTVFTSILAHGSLGHLFFNGLVLFFFGPLLEMRMGWKRYSLLFWGAGVLSGLAQLGFTTQFLGNPDPSIVGASGAIMGVMGALTFLAPRLTVLLFFVLPVPLWGITIAYAAFDLLGALGPADGIAHVAHLAGLALGLGIGRKWREQGYKFPGKVGLAPGRQRW